jgi:hypothetical protein
MSEAREAAGSLDQKASIKHTQSRYHEIAGYRPIRNRVVLSGILISDTYPHTSARWCTRKENDNGCANRDGYDWR